jgi:hypothetical protein
VSVFGLVLIPIILAEVLCHIGAPAKNNCRDYTFSNAIDSVAGNKS